MRYLLIDSITELEPATRIAGVKNATMSEDFFTHHFPQRPIMPGMLILESMVQLARWLHVTDSDFQETLLLAGVEQCKFRSYAMPADRIDIEVKPLPPPAAGAGRPAVAGADGAGAPARLPGEAPGRDPAGDGTAAGVGPDGDGHPEDAADRPEGPGGHTDTAADEETEPPRFRGVARVGTRVATAAVFTARRLPLAELDDPDATKRLFDILRAHSTRRPL